MPAFCMPSFAFFTSSKETLRCPQRMKTFPMS
jgi:hypothetical protein